MTHALRIAASVLLSVALAAPALAAEKKKGDDLPGVDRDLRLVKPTEETPDAEKFVKDEDGFIQIGENTRMKVSGLIRYDIDFNTSNRKTPLPPR
ncbi:MAG: hypothetical protein ABTQ31_04590 [Rhizobiaceae bacterium]